MYFLQPKEKKSKSERDESRERNISDMDTVEIVTHGRDSTKSIFGISLFIFRASTAFQLIRKKTLSKENLMGVFRLKTF